MSDASLHNELLRQAVAAIKERDLEAARGFLEEILEEDDENVRAWLLLARITDNDDEKRLALTTVLQLDPENERAQAMLNKLDGKLEVAPEDEEIIPGVTRRQALLIGGGVGAFVLLILLTVFAVTFSQNASRSSDNRRATQTQVAFEQVFADQTQVIVDQTEAAVVAQETQLALTTATPTPTATRPVAANTLPPTWTPDASGGVQARPTALPLPENAGGLLLGWSGIDTLNTGFLPIVAWDLSQGGARTQIGTESGYNVSSADGQRIYYSRYFRQTRNVSPEAIDFDGGDPQLLADLWTGSGIGLSDPDEASISNDGLLVVFTAISQDNFTREVYLLNLEDNANTLTQLTNDPNGEYSAPEISPDNRLVAAIRNRTNGEPQGPDLITINVSNRRPVELTSDGAAVEESDPVWSPDGRSLAYAALVQGEQNHDIIVTSSDGTVSFPPVESEFDDIQPVYSPDGVSLAFASNRTGEYDIFVYEFRTQTLSQVTDTEEDDFVSDWVMPGG